MDFEEVVHKAADKGSVWHYFLRNKSKSEAQCKTCKKILKSAGGSTSSLQKHLKNIHNINLGTTSVTTTTSTTSTPGSSSEEPNQKKTKLTHFYESDANPSMQMMVARMASVDGLPLRTFANSQDLKRLFEKTGNKLPKTTDTVRNIILRECEKRKQEVISEVKAILSDEKKFSISFDEWTSNRNRRYIGLTLHSPNFSGACPFRNLGLIRIHGSMNAENCVQLIETKLNEFGVSLHEDVVAQTTDGCSLMVKFGKHLKSFHQLCIAHAIQLAVVNVMYKRNEYNDIELEMPQADEDEDDLTLAEIAARMRNGDFNDEVDDVEEASNEDGAAEFNNETLEETISQQAFRYHDLISKVRKVVKTFKKSPTKNDEILQKHVKADFGQELSLILDGKTRWSSIAFMLSRFIKLKISITKALIDLKTDIEFSEDDWRNIGELLNVLDIIKTVVEALCRRDATLLTADVAVTFAIKKLNEMNTHISNKMAAALKSQYNKRRLTQAATLRYLTNPEKYFQNIENEDATVFPRLLSEDMPREIVSLLQRTNTTQIPMEGISLTETRQEAEYLTNEEELNRQLKEASTARTSKPDDLYTTVRVEMALFENGGQRGRYLSLAYQHLITIPPTSVEPERIFSSAGIICNRLRSALGDKTLDALIFLRSYYLSKKK